MEPIKILFMVNEALTIARAAFPVYRALDLQQRAGFLHAIARQLETHAAALIQLASRETNLAEGRLHAELKRTVFQVDSYADACAEGTWLDLRLDTADPGRQPQPKPDVRKMLVPLGPVVVFGASNFPFAYSTAGGDSACALAAGCPVIIKGHPGHARTSAAVARIVQDAARVRNLPEGVFQHLEGEGYALGQELVQHPLTKAVAFTGSLQGGRALFDLAARRPEPIPVFAEMGSTNPVFLLPGKLEAEAESIAAQYAASITGSAGQFCTKPGILVGLQSEALQRFEQFLSQRIQATPPELMLHEGIARHFHERRRSVLQVLQEPSGAATGAEVAGHSLPTLVRTDAATFLQHMELREEVFGPYSLIVACRDRVELMQVALSLDGQLTASVQATEEDAGNFAELLDWLPQICGRLVWNGVPTGVEVCLSMHHGGPYPATTDSRFTAVGADGIRRFARPVCYQNHPDHLLPAALQNANPLGLWRTVNNKLTKEPL
ncbi:MAG TPA: aldehyde dehydrogenase (NADP(+)) [Chitinophagaceae bacterium]|jgi:NADP-dependent aldehyde dehydrogenase|nr:aldehyde dehydrogenase (NADP(+)) [Chitinophagaceae bacterium]